MDWQAVATVVTGLGVGLSFWLTLRGQKQTERIAAADREAAQHLAERTEAATRLQGEYTERMVDALEDIATRRPGASTALVGVRWKLTYETGDTFRLENSGTAIAQDVTVSGHQSLVGPDIVSGGPDLGPSEAMTFMAALSLATSDTTISVEWRESGKSEPLEWKYPLPAARHGK